MGTEKQGRAEGHSLLRCKKLPKFSEDAHFHSGRFLPFHKILEDHH
jgi:hypothetical protein